MSARLLGLGLASATMLAAATAQAAPPTLAPEPAAIHGGQAAAPCEFPTAVALYENNVLCSGTLVAPRLVLTAAHCIGGGPGPSVISFGESAFEPARTVPVDHCLANPAATGELGPWDFAYCLLAEPVDDIPPTPILLGCETAILTYGQPVVIAGFGATDLDTSGIKHSGATIVSSQSAGEVVVVGADGTAACSGDSGGPAFVRLGDGGWRAFGIVSGGLSCEGSVTYVTMHAMIGWAEQQTGMDFTPCHDADGTWNPGPACGGASLDAHAPSLTAAWPGCAGERASPSSTCGPAYASESDVEAPIVTIIAPLDGAAFLDAPASFDVQVEALDVQGDGPASGVEQVELYVQGELVASDAGPPWSFAGASFPAGTWSLEARATDWRGNVGVSGVVTVMVGPASGDGDGDGDGDSGTDSGTGSGTGTSSETETGAGEPDEPSGCACRFDSSPRSWVGLGLLVLLLLPARRQGRRGRQGTIE